VVKIIDCDLSRKIGRNGIALLGRASTGGLFSVSGPMFDA
jgi:hypothetical protein